MKICRDCGVRVVEEARFCHICGCQQFLEQAKLAPHGKKPPQPRGDSPLPPDDDDYTSEQHFDEYDDEDDYYDYYDPPSPQQGKTKPKGFWPGRPRWLFPAIIAICTCFIFAATLLFVLRLFSTDLPTPGGEDIFVRVPNVLGVSLPDAGSAFVRAGLIYRIENREYSDVIPANHVFMQDVPVDTVMPKNSIVNLTISAGPQMQVVPFVEGVNEHEAISILRDMGFSASFVHDVTSHFAPDIVVLQNPAAGQPFELSRPVNLRISDGPQASPVPPAALDVPDVAMHSLHDAATFLGQARFLAHVLRRTHNDTVPIGTVLSQSPAAGTRAAPYSQVGMEVAINAFAQVAPSVRFLPLQTAERIMHTQGFTFNITSESDPVVLAGNIIRQNPAGSSILQYGENISLTVSTGPAPVQMPDVSGLGPQEVRDVLHELGLVVSIEHERGSAAQDAVASTYPAAGAQVWPGRDVRVTLSTSAEVVNVPNVVGQSEAAAMSEISRGGLSVGSVFGQRCRTTPAGVVLNQFPPANTALRVDTAVTLVVSQGADQVNFQMPLLGLAIGEAAEMLLAGGFGVRTAHEFSQTTPAQHVISMEPGQANLLQGDFVTLTVSLGVRYASEAGQPGGEVTPPAVTHTVSYNPNSATGSSITHNVAHGTSHTVVQNTFTLADYTFAGWNTRADGIGTTFAPGEVIPNITADLALYALWVADDTTVPVASILGIPQQAPAGVPLVLAPIVAPPSATHQDVIWSVVIAGQAGAAFADGVLNTTGAGAATIRATIIDGLGDENFTQDFIIEFLEQHVPVVGLLNLPSHAYVGVPLGLFATVMPWYATNQGVQWQVMSPGLTGASIIGGTLTAQSAGVITVRATIPGGTSPTMPFVHDFQLTVVDNFIPVTHLQVQTTSAIAGQPLTLGAQVLPINATNQMIQWSVEFAGVTGAVITGDVLSTTSPGIATLRVTIPFGISRTQNFTQTFDIIVNPAPAVHIPVSSITLTSPATVRAGEVLPLFAQVLPANATNTHIDWSIIHPGGDTAATIQQAALHPTTPGFILIRATITNGASPTTPATQDFTIDVTPGAD